MKKKVLSIIGVAAVGAAMVFSLNTNMRNSADLDFALAQAEAIAGGEVMPGFSWSKECFRCAGGYGIWQCYSGGSGGCISWMSCGDNYCAN